MKNFEMIFNKLQLFCSSLSNLQKKKGLYVYSILFNKWLWNWPTEIKSREERSQQYFGETSSDWNFDDWGNNGNKSAEENSQRPRVGNQQQLLMLEENSAFVEQREKEIQNVVRSIYELNTIFKVTDRLHFFDNLF